MCAARTDPACSPRLCRTFVPQGFKNCVYTRRIPFHPGRLREFVAENFVFFEPASPEDEEEGEEEEEGGHEGAATTILPTEGAALATSTLPPEPSLGDTTADDVTGSGEEEDVDADGEALDRAMLEEMRAEATRNSSKFGRILRSKGFMWIATRSYGIGEWSQAGVIGRLEFAGPWFVCVRGQPA